jgi:prevent-host-death family protein
VKTVNVHEAKTHLSKLLKGVTRGTEIVIARGGKPIARLLPLERARPLPVLGADRGKYTVPEDFDAPLPEAVLAAFEGRSRRPG